jgi:membrane protease YdiL (CAAX protease family)
MSSLNTWDHVFALIVFLIYPVYAKATFQKTLDAIRDQGETARIASYKQVIMTWAGFASCVLAMWVLLDRDWTELGFVFPDTVPLLVGLAVAAVVISLVVIPMRKQSQSRKGASEFMNQVGEMILFMPASRAEESWFKAVSVNAGLVEELIFRGYLIWYLDHFMGPWWAGVLAIFLFGLGHIYQGLKMLPGILFISAIAVTLYVYTGSLLVPVLFHIFLDALQGHYIARIQRVHLDAEADKRNEDLVDDGKPEQEHQD